MILIPEIETVLILVPRTGSGSLRRAVAEKYPRSVLLYRHMEADGVPHGYDRWTKVGVVRNPLDRLWSLYKFMRDYANPEYAPEYIASLNRSAARPFDDWLLHNETVFSHPYDLSGRGGYRPQFASLHPVPENRKSQWIYLRPDLGTVIWPFHRLDDLAKSLEVELGRVNETPDEPRPPLSAAASVRVTRIFEWDFRAANSRASF